MAVFDSEDLNAISQVPYDEEEVLNKCKEYDELEYPIILKYDTDENGSYWIAEHPDLPGCKTNGKTKEEALINLDDAKKSWIYAQLCNKDDVPKPSTLREIDECSGKILLRLPKELHFRLIQNAKLNETSLNQYLVFLLSYSLGETSVFNSVDEILDSIKGVRNLILEQKSNTIKNTQLFDQFNVFLEQFKDINPKSVRRINTYSEEISFHQPVKFSHRKKPFESDMLPDINSLFSQH